MQIPQRRLLDRDANAAFAIAAVAVSIFVFAYSIRFGQLAILAFYALWLPVFLLRPRILLDGAHRVLPLLVLPAVAALSTLWSDVPATTLRAAIQYGTTVFCGLLAARIVSVPNLAAGGVLGGLAVLVYSAFNGSYAYDAVDGTYAFNGAFGSKNQLGYFCSLAVLFSAAVLLLYRAAWGWRMIALITAALAIVLLRMSDSATSILSLAFAVCILGIALGLAMLPPRIRDAAIVILVSGGVVLAAVALYLGAFDATLAAFGKDTTLTGRTYLWREGLSQGDENPLVGLGYYAFWVPGRPHAEALWEQFYISAKTGFHFHNTLIEAYVALGIVGVLLVGALTVALVVLALITVHRGTAAASSALCSALALLFVLRSTVEIDFFTPYTAGSFLVPFLLLGMADRLAAARPKRRGGPYDACAGRPVHPPGSGPLAAGGAP